MWDPAACHGGTHVSPPEREAFARLCRWGLVDAYRLHHAEPSATPGGTTAPGNFHKNFGMRIDHLLVTAPVAARTVWAEIDREARKGKPIPSDHAPLVIDLDEPGRAFDAGWAGAERASPRGCSLSRVARGVHRRVRALPTAPSLLPRDRASRGSASSPARSTGPARSRASAIAQARLLIVGLAPAAHGANRTGQMFTGDSSGSWLYEALHRYGWSNRPNALRRDDGLILTDCRITAAAHCAPPDNAPTKEELAVCRQWLLALFNVVQLLPLIVVPQPVDSLVHAVQRTGSRLPVVSDGIPQTRRVDRAALSVERGPEHRRVLWIGLVARIAGAAHREVQHVIWPDSERAVGVLAGIRQVADDPGEVADATVG